MADLDNDDGNFLPSVKIPNEGDAIVVALVDVNKDIPWTEFGTGNPKLGKDGKPRTQDLVIGVVVDGSKALIKDDDGDIDYRGDKHRHPRQGELVCIYFAGHHRWEWIQAKKKLTPKLKTGDVLRWAVERFEPGQLGKDKKVTSVAIRKPKPGEEAQVAECDRLHDERKATAPAMATSGAGGDTWADEEEPF